MNSGCLREAYVNSLNRSSAIRLSANCSYVRPPHIGQERSVLIVGSGFIISAGFGLAQAQLCRALSCAGG